MANSNLTGPDYYRRGATQVWDFIREQDLNFHLGNAIKYVCRAGHKDSKVSDLKKAIHYLQNELENTIVLDATSSGVPQSVQGAELQNTIREVYPAHLNR